MLNISVLFVTIFACSAGCLAQTTSAPSGGTAAATTRVNAAPAAVSTSPTVDQILEGYVKALGGRAAYEKLTSRVAKGTLEIQGMGAKGTVEMYTKAPNKEVLIASIPNFGTLEEGYNGTTGWSLDPINGLREKSGAELSSAKIDAAFYHDLKLKELYTSAKTSGEEKVGDRDAYVVEFTSSDGGKERYDFDKKSGLLIRFATERESSAGKIPIEMTFDDYKEVDGIQVAHTLRQASPAATVVIKLDEVKHNLPIDDKKFDKPPAP